VKVGPLTFCVGICSGDTGGCQEVDRRPPCGRRSGGAQDAGRCAQGRRDRPLSPSPQTALVDEVERAIAGTVTPVPPASQAAARHADGAGRGAEGTGVLVVPTCRNQARCSDSSGRADGVPASEAVLPFHAKWANQWGQVTGQTANRGSGTPQDDLGGPLLSTGPPPRRSQASRTPRPGTLTPESLASAQGAPGPSPQTERHAR